MLIPNHPHDERLSALASGDPETVADSALSEHVASCLRCADIVAELGALRASLAELPDLRPHRPLRLLPPVADAPPSRVDRVGGWARRFFAPVLTAGAALAMVGLVGTTAPLIAPAAQPGAAPETFDMAQEAAPGATDGGDPTTDSDALSGASASGSSEPRAAAAGDGDGSDGGETVPSDEAAPRRSEVEAPPAAEDGDADAGRLALTDERPIWPMILFAGVAIMIAAVLLRWILAPRAG